MEGEFKAGDFTGESVDKCPFLNQRRNGRLSGPIPKRLYRQSMPNSPPIQVSPPLKTASFHPSELLP